MIKIMMPGSNTSSTTIINTNPGAMSSGGFLYSREAAGGDLLYPAYPNLTNGANAPAIDDEPMDDASSSSSSSSSVSGDDCAQDGPGEGDDGEGPDLTRCGGIFHNPTHDVIQGLLSLSKANAAAAGPPPAREVAAHGHTSALPQAPQHQRPGTDMKPVLPAPGATTAAPTDTERKRRMLREKNNLSARKSRDNQREYVKVLENGLCILAHDYKALFSFATTMLSYDQLSDQPWFQSDRVKVVVQLLSLADTVSSHTNDFAKVDPDTAHPDHGESSSDSGSAPPVPLAAKDARIHKRHYSSRVATVDKRRKASAIGNICELLGSGGNDASKCKSSSKAANTSETASETASETTPSGHVILHTSPGQQSASISLVSSGATGAMGSTSSLAAAIRISHNVRSRARAARSDSPTPSSCGSSSSSDTEQPSRPLEALSPAMEAWSVAQVGAFFRQLSMAELATRLEALHMNGQVLIQCDLKAFLASPFELKFSEAVRVLDIVKKACVV